MKTRFLVLLVVIGLITMVSQALAADTGTVNINANVVGTCKFTTNTANISVTLDPSQGGTQTGNGSLEFWCTKNASYTVTDDDGLHESGPNGNRVKHQSLNEYIPYTFSYSPTSGTGNGPQTPITLSVSASFAQSDYTNASVGSYTDTVTITISP